MKWYCSNLISSVTGSQRHTLGRNDRGTQGGQKNKNTTAIFDTSEDETSIFLGERTYRRPSHLEISVRRSQVSIVMVTLLC